VVAASAVARWSTSREGRGRSGASIPCLKMNLNNAAQRRTAMIAKDFIMAKDK
jgi:hypothetical protein